MVQGATALKPYISPEKITGKRPSKETALKMVGGSLLNAPVFTGDATNKIIKFDRTKVQPKPNNLQSLIQNLSSNVYNNQTNVQNIFGGKETKDPKERKGLFGFFGNLKDTIQLIQFLGSKKNLNKLKENLENLKDTFSESFEAAKIIRKVIKKIYDQLSGMDGISSGGGGNLLGSLASIFGLRAGSKLFGKNATKLAKPAIAKESTSLLPKALKTIGKFGTPGKLLLGAGALATGAAVSGLSQPGETTEIQPDNQTPEVPGNVLDRFDSILDRFDKILDGLTKGKDPGTRSKRKQESTGSSATSGGSRPSSPGNSGVTIKDDKQALKELGISQEQFNAYKQGVADVEGAAYNKMGGAGGRFAGRYQMGSGEIASAAAVMGIPTPSQQEFLSNPELQEKIYMGRTVLMNRRMMQLSPEYRTMSPSQRLPVLAGAQLGEGSLTDFLKGKSVSDSYGVEIQRWINAAKRRLSGVSASTITPMMTPGQSTAQALQQAPTAGKPQVSFINLGGQQQVQANTPSPGIVAPSPPAQNGPTAPMGSSFNPDNFLVLYSRMVYNIVDG